MSVPNDEDANSTLSALAIFQSAVYGNDTLLLQQQQQQRQSQNPEQKDETKARETDYEDLDNQSQSGSEHIDETHVLSGTEQPDPDPHTSDGYNDNNQQPNNNNNNNNDRTRINWADTDDDFKQEFFKLLLQKYEEEKHAQQEEYLTDEEFKESNVVDISLPHSKSRCDATILKVLPNNEYQVKYIDPADDKEKITIVSREFLRGRNIELTKENAKKYEDQDAINNILLQGIATFTELEYLAVCIHPWIDKYFFKPYLPKGFMQFFMITENDMNIDTIIETRDGKNKYDYISKFLALTILSFIGESVRSHKLNCIWCGVDDIFMNKTRARRRLLLGGVTYDEHVTILCDNCGLTFHRDDVMYTCQNDNHDVCIKCISEKVNAFQNLLNLLNQFDFKLVYKLDISPDITNEIVSFACGKLLQFDK